MADAVIEMGWLDRIVNVNFGGNFLLVVATGTVADRDGTPVATPTITLTPQGEPQDFVAYKKLDQSVNKQNITVPSKQIPVTIFTIWNPVLPLPDSSNIDAVLTTFGQQNQISYVGQFMELHENIIQDLLLFEHPPVLVNPDGTFNSFGDAQASIKYMSKTTLDTWYTAEGAPIDAGFINNFPATINATRLQPGSAAASNITKVLYAVPASGSLQVNIADSGPNPSSSCNVSLYTTAKSKIQKISDTTNLTPDAGDARAVAASRDFVVKFTAGKKPTVTVS